MLAAVEPAASEAKFDDEFNPDVRRMRWDINRMERLLEAIHQWLKTNYPKDFPDELNIG